MENNLMQLLQTKLLLGNGGNGGNDGNGKDNTMRNLLLFEAIKYLKSRNIRSTASMI